MLLDLPTLTNMLNLYSSRYPYPEARFKTNPTKYISSSKQFVPRKESNGQNTTLLSNSYLQSIEFTSKTLTKHQNDELFLNTAHLVYNMYFYGDLEFVYKLPADTIARIEALEAGFNWQEYIVYSVTIVKKTVLGEPIDDLAQYLRFYDINEKKAHRDRLFYDIQTAFASKDSKVRDFDTKNMVHYKDSRLVKMKIEEYLKEVLQNAKEPKPDLAKDVLKQIDRELKQITSLMFGRISKSSVSFFAYLVIKFFKNSFQQILIERSLVDVVKEHTAQMRGPIIFAPTHKSYFDFILVSYIIQRFGEQVPFIAAADNMHNILGVG